MITDRTLNICEKALSQYLSILSEQPDLMIPEMKQEILDAFNEVRKHRQESILNIDKTFKSIAENPEMAEELCVFSNNSFSH